MFKKAKQKPNQKEKKRKETKTEPSYQHPGAFDS